MSVVLDKYWTTTLVACEEDGLTIRIYLLGTIVLISVNLILLVLLVNRSAQGSIVETHLRRLVAPLLVVK